MSIDTHADTVQLEQNEKDRIHAAFMVELENYDNDSAMWQEMQHVVKNFSRGYFTQFKTKKWDKMSDKVFIKIKAWLGLRDDGFEWRNFDTPNYKAITALCQDTWEARDMKAIVGDTGLGKTAALMQFCKAKPRATYVLCLNSMSQKELLREIAVKMGIRYEGSMNSYVLRIADKLNNTGGLLVLDDLGKSITKFYARLQEIYDLTEGRCGIVIAGTPFLMEHMVKMRDKRTNSYPELYRRIAYWQPLKAPSRNFIKTVCEYYGMKDKNAIRLLQDNVTDYGTLRAWMKNVVKLGKDNPSREDLSQLRLQDFHYTSMS